MTEPNDDDKPADAADLLGLVVWHQRQMNRLLATLLVHAAEAAECKPDENTKTQSSGDHRGVGGLHGRLLDP